MASATAIVRAGERTTLPVDCDAIEPTRPIELEATLVVPPAWDLDSFHFRIHPLRAGVAFASIDWTEETLELDVSGHGVVRPDDMTNGIYLFEFFTLGRVAHLEVRELQGPTEQVTFQVPPPVRLRLWVTESASGAPVDVSALMVAPPSLEGAAGRATVLDELERDATGAVSCDVPAGAQRLFVTLADGRRLERTLTATGTQQDVVLAVD